ncbi:PrsW family intramembrane metalloprotease, partial [filamentous cyanobacterium CCP1]
MTESSSHVTVLRQVPSPDRTQPAIAFQPYSLTSSETILIGRDPRCQIILDSQVYAGV